MSQNALTAHLAADHAVQCVVGNNRQVSLRRALSTFNEEVQIGFAYLQVYQDKESHKTHLGLVMVDTSITDIRGTYTACVAMQSTRLHCHVAALFESDSKFDSNWITHHGPPRFVSGIPEFGKPVSLDLLATHNCVFLPRGNLLAEIQLRQLGCSPTPNDWRS